MMAELETLLRVNTVLATVPIFVGIGVTRILARQRQYREEMEKVKQENAIFIVEMIDARERIVRLENLVMKEETKERID